MFMPIINYYYDCDAWKQYFIHPFLVHKPEMGRQNNIIINHFMLFIRSL